MNGTIPEISAQTSAACEYILKGIEAGTPLRALEQRGRRSTAVTGEPTAQHGG